MAKRYSLSAEPRSVVGKQVKQLRRQNLVPANIFGHKIESTSISLPQVEFSTVYKQAGETGLIDITVGGESQTRPALVHSMLLDPVTAAVLHVDFYQVNLKEKLTAMVPLDFVGESPMVKNKEGLLLELLQEVEVECLPTDIPSSIEVDVSILTELDQAIHVGDLKLPAGVEMQTEAEEMVCKIDAAQMEEEVEEVAEVEVSEEAATDEAGQTEAEASAE